MTDASGTEKYYYDKLGRVTKAIKTVDSIDYTTETTYDALGRTTTIKYPDGEAVNYSYDTGGNLTGVTGHVTYSNFNALGQAGNITYANGVSTTYQYYTTNNRLYSITTNGPTQGLQNLSYNYDNTGNITTITDILDSNRTQNFTYDDLNRLTQAQSTAYGTLTYQYNQIGNITYNSMVGSYTYGTKPHAVTKAGANTYSYDANGNMTGGAGRTITYNYDNMPSKITKSVSTYFTYDYSGQRVKKKVSSTTTVYIGKHYECTSSLCTKYIFAGNNRIASKTSSATYYYHTDHLGSSSIITDATGAKVQGIYYYPYGGTRSSTGTANIKHKFTGQEEDAETGLYYYGARYYDPILGRFISADSIVQDPFYPQSLNRYSYALDNPLKYVDPNGQIPWLVVAMIVGAVIGGVSAAIQGGDVGDILAGAFIGAVAAGIGYGFGVGAVDLLALQGPAAAIVGGAVGGMVGGIISSGESGKIGQGMLIGAISGGVGGYIGGLGGGTNIYLKGLVMIGSGAIIGGVASELTGGNFGEGLKIGGISAAISFALTQYFASTNKAGEESEKKAQRDLNINKGENASRQNKSLIEEMMENSYMVAEDVNPYKGTGAVGGSGPIREFGVKSLKGGEALYKGIRYIALDDYNFYRATGEHKYGGFKNVEWNEIPGNNFDEKWKNWYKDGH
ncbi:MAG: hypothetical protein HZC12_10815 [Nitrospirae bacterium]|nr:hypothetical protein [Nitrospirota bacterium]